MPDELLGGHREGNQAFELGSMGQPFIEADELEATGEAIGHQQRRCELGGVGGPQRVPSQ